MTFYYQGEERPDHVAPEDAWCANCIRAFPPEKITTINTGQFDLRPLMYIRFVEHLCPDCLDQVIDRVVGLSDLRPILVEHCH